MPPAAIHPYPMKARLWIKQFKAQLCRDWQKKSIMRIASFKGSQIESQAEMPVGLVLGCWRWEAEKKARVLKRDLGQFL